MRYSLFRTAFSLVALGYFLAVWGPAKAATLTIVQSQALGQVSPLPGGLTKTAPLFVDLGGGPGSTTVDVLAGRQQFIATTQNANLPGPASATVGGETNIIFRYDGADAFTIPQYALTWDVDATFTRIFNTPDPEFIDTFGSTGAVATMSILRGGGDLSASARMDIAERDDGTITSQRPNQSQNGIDLLFFGASPANLTARFGVPELVLNPGDVFTLRTGFFGTATSNGTACGGCIFNVDSIVNGSNTAQLSFVLPVGLTVNPLADGSTPSWILGAGNPEIAPVPLPAGWALLLPALAGLAVMRRRRP